jgi:hypothetical protein
MLQVVSEGRERLPSFNCDEVMQPRPVKLTSDNHLELPPASVTS